VFAVRVSSGGPTAALDALPASDNAPAIPNTVTAFVRPFCFDFCLSRDMVEASNSPHPTCNYKTFTSRRQCAPGAERKKTSKEARRASISLGGLKLDIGNPAAVAPVQASLFILALWVKSGHCWFGLVDNCHFTLDSELVTGAHRAI
jgi:hypothetical protein